MNICDGRSRDASRLSSKQDAAEAVVQGSTLGQSRTRLVGSSFFLRTMQPSKVQRNFHSRRRLPRFISRVIGDRPLCLRADTRLIMPLSLSLSLSLFLSLSLSLFLSPRRMSRREIIGHGNERVI